MMFIVADGYESGCYIGGGDDEGCFMIRGDPSG